MDKLSAGSYGRFVAIEAGFFVRLLYPVRPAVLHEAINRDVCPIERDTHGDGYYKRLVEMAQIASTISHYIYVHNARIQYTHGGCTQCAIFQKKPRRFSFIELYALTGD